MALSVALGCGGSDASEAAREIVRRDSAGIEIVQNLLSPAELPVWRLSSEPSLRLGALDGPAELQFFRVSAARRPSDGRVVVANGGSGEIRVFDERGNLVLSFGSEGEGPMEFGAILGMWTGPGDTLLVYDASHQRLAEWTLAGEFVRVSPLSPMFLNPPQARGRLSDESVIFAELYLDLPESGFDWIPYIVRRYASDGTELDTLARVPGQKAGRIEMPGGELFGGGPHFGARAVAVGGGEAVHLATGRSYEVRRIGLDGKVDRLLRWTGPPRDVEEADVQWIRERALASSETDEGRRRALRFFEARPVEAEFPTVEDLVLATDGGLWVREYERPGDDPAQDWLIFDPDGRLAARIELPERLRVFEIGPDYVLGVERDELDVEYVVSYPLLRGSP